MKNVVVSDFNYSSGFCFEEEGGILIRDMTNHRPKVHRPHVGFAFTGKPSWCFYLNDEVHRQIAGYYTITGANDHINGNHWMSHRIAGYQEWVLTFQDRRSALWFKLRWL